MFISKYIDLKKSHGLYKAFGMVAAEIAVKGDMEDLQELYDTLSEDIENPIDDALDELEEMRFKSTEYERKLREAGHKQSDFI